MKENAKHTIYLFIMLFVFIIPLELFEFSEHDAEAFLPQVKTLEQLLEKRQNFFNMVDGRNVDRLVNILIVPGHDDEDWGTQYKGTKEVELNRELAENLYQYLSHEAGINAVLASDTSGYNPIFENYFKDEQESIKTFIQDSKQKFTEKVATDNLELSDEDFHNVATEDVAYRLYGINRWVNNQNFDLVIHIHFNDYRGHKRNKAGRYTGFSVYVPDKLFENYELSRALGDAIFEQMKKVQSVSNLDKEKSGVIEDQELIAVGANASLEAGSVLIEYGYIYEDKIFDEKKRAATLDDFAYATYAGVKGLLHETPTVIPTH